ncbi:MAG: DUF4167 domain-containing protein [Sphingomicrobium sp.]
MSGGNNSGNRQDNRQRGNAAQLLEKYKSMARDSQLAGDRVQTEYYLQFADHYFRMLGESRPRVDEQQRRERSDDNYSDDDSDDRMDGDIDGDNENDGDSDDDQPRQQQQRPRSDEQQQRPRDEQPQRSRPRPANDRPEPRRERANNRPRDDEEGRNRPQPRDNGGERIDFAVLPPAIGTDDSNDFAPVVDEQAPAPKRRVRRPRAEETGSDDASAS